MVQNFVEGKVGCPLQKLKMIPQQGIWVFFKKKNPKKLTNKELFDADYS